MTILEEYAKLCEEYDNLSKRLHVVDNRMRAVRLEYMRANSTCGITDLMLRREIKIKIVAALANNAKD